MVDKLIYVVKYRKSDEVIVSTTNPEEAKYHYGHTLAFNPKLTEKDLIIIKTTKK